MKDTGANGPEFISKTFLRWVADLGLDVALIDPGTPEKRDG